MSFGLRDALFEQGRDISDLEVLQGVADASIDDLVRWTIAVVDGQPVQEGFAALVDTYGQMADPPTIGVHVVSGLANPRFLVEIDAVAVTCARCEASGLPGPPGDTIIRPTEERLAQTLDATPVSDASRPVVTRVGPEATTKGAWDHALPV